jgi:MFS family permease
VDVVGRRPVPGLSGLVVVGGVVGLLVLSSAPWPWLWAVAGGLGTTVAFQVCLAESAQLAPRHRIGATAGVMPTLGHIGAVIGPLAVLAAAAAAVALSLALAGPALSPSWRWW